MYVQIQSIPDKSRETDDIVIISDRPLRGLVQVALLEAVVVAGEHRDPAAILRFGNSSDP